MIKYLGKALLVEEEGKKILVIGDLHLGYEESMNISGVYIYRKMYEEMVGYLDRVFELSGKVDVIVLLGDVKHGFGALLKQEWNDFSSFVDYLEDKCREIVITKGNHDRNLEFIANRKKVRVLDCFTIGQYAFLHGDRDSLEIWDNEVKFVVVGHLHPAVILKEGIKVEKYKCFLEGKIKDKTLIIVPSFIAYSEGSDPRENKHKMAWEIDFSKFNVKIVSENLEVLDFGKLNKLR